jgi:hypothetical protein
MVFFSRRRATSPPCLEQKFNNQHCEGGRIMTYDVDVAIADFAIERSRTERRRQTERSSSNQGMTPAIKMLIGDWHVDELGILTREIKAHG